MHLQKFGKHVRLHSAKTAIFIQNDCATSLVAQEDLPTRRPQPDLSIYFHAVPILIWRAVCRAAGILAPNVLLRGASVTTRPRVRETGNSLWILKDGAGCLEWAVTDSRQGVVLECGCWTWDLL
jgi:hypothetical protein